MTKQQQELYERLLKKVNEFCLGQAAEDVIAAIDDLVETYEPKKIVMNCGVSPLQALEIICGQLVKMDLLFIDGNQTNYKKWIQTQEHKNGIEFHKKYGSPTSIIEKSLKALEIIKKKRLLWGIEYQPYKEIGDYRAWDNEFYESIELTPEEYELLKEIYDESTN